MHIYHLSIGPVAWSCKPFSLSIVWSWTQVTSLLALKIPYGLWWIAESYHGPQSTWSINMLLYKVLMIHDQHSISLVEYVYDARRWYVSPCMTTKCHDFDLHPDFSNAEDETVSAISLFQPPVESTCDSLSQGVHWGVLITNNATSMYSAGDQVPGRLWTAIVWLKMKLWMKLLGFIGDSITLIEKFMQSVLSLCLLKTSPKGWLINIERLKFKVTHWSLIIRMPNYAKHIYMGNKTWNTWKTSHWVTGTLRSRI